MAEPGDIQPVRLDQFIKGRDGRMILVEDDVGGVAADLREIDSCLKLRYSEVGGWYVVYREWEQRNGETKQELVLTAQECDQRIVNRVREIDAQGRGNYDFAKELERQDDQRKRNSLEVMKERQRDVAERAYHELRKAAGVKTRIYVP